MESINANSLSGTVTWVWKNQKRQLKESEKQNDYWTISVKWVANAPLKLEGEKKLSWCHHESFVLNTVEILILKQQRLQPRKYVSFYLLDEGIHENFKV